MYYVLTFAKQRQINIKILTKYFIKHILSTCTSITLPFWSAANSNLYFVEKYTWL